LVAAVIWAAVGLPLVPVMGAGGIPLIAAACAFTGAVFESARDVPTATRG